MAEQEFELKLSGGKVVKWIGKDGETAAKRYVDTFQEAIVIAWRPIAHGIFLYNHNIAIIE